MEFCRQNGKTYAHRLLRVVQRNVDILGVPRHRAVRQFAEHGRRADEGQGLHAVGAAGARKVCVRGKWFDYISKNCQIQFKSKPLWWQFCFS